jgi:hypothetical protein
MKAYACCEVVLFGITSLPSNITFGFTAKNKRIILHGRDELSDIVIESRSKITVYAEDSCKPSYIYVNSKAKLYIIYNDIKSIGGLVRIKKGIYKVKRQVEFKPRNF